MPTYQYRCTTCSRDLEAVQKFTDPPLTECPECHGRLRKVFSPVGVVFKGSGFYSTDNRSSGHHSVPTHTEPSSGGSHDTSSGDSHASDSGHADGSSHATANSSHDAAPAMAGAADSAAA